MILRRSPRNKLYPQTREMKAAGVTYLWINVKAKFFFCYIFKNAYISAVLEAIWI